MRADQSAEALAVRMACLEERRDALRALTDVVLARGQHRVVQAVNAAAGAAVDRAVRRRRRAVGRESSGRARAGAARPGRVTARPPRRGEGAQRHRTVSGRPAQAGAAGRRRALRRLRRAARGAARTPGLAGVPLGCREAAEAALEQALWVAIAARRDDIALACAAAARGHHRLPLQWREEGERWGRLGQALLTRLGSGHERSAAWLNQNRGLILLRHGDFRGRWPSCAPASRSSSRCCPPNIPTSAGRGAASAMLGEIGDHAGALAATTSSLDIFRQAFGDDNPLLGHPLSNRGEVLAALGRHREAQRDLRTRSSRWSALVGPDHRWVALPADRAGQGPGRRQPSRRSDRAARARRAHPRARRAQSRAWWPRASLRSRARAGKAGGDRARRGRWRSRRATATASSPRSAKQAAEIDAWLAANARPAINRRRQLPGCGAALVV